MKSWIGRERGHETRADRAGQDVHVLLATATWGAPRSDCAPSARRRFEGPGLAPGANAKPTRWAASA